MRRPITLTTAAPSPEQQKSIKAVVVLIGANDYGFAEPIPDRAAE